MLQYLKNLRKRQKSSTESKSSTDDGEEYGGGFFSTDSDIATHFLPVSKRVENALKRAVPITLADYKPVNAAGGAMDSATAGAVVPVTSKTIGQASGNLPVQQLEWYAGQGFIGWQMAAILSQNWLIDKVCSMPGTDAVRHGYTITVNDGTDVDPDVLDEIRRLDKKMDIKGQCRQFVKMGRIFGIRHALFIIDGIDYEAPFNPDGITPGSYRGISQIDPYWLAPELSPEAAGNPSSKDFYNPTWWRVNGRRVHHSHFVIMICGEELPDILKPSYMYGGIPIPQKIYERVYAAERTANEAPMLAMTKRMTVYTTDAGKALANASTFNNNMEIWSALMNNFGIKMIDTDDKVEMHDTTLNDLDMVIMTQFQLVAAAGNVPGTKLMGTQPKGFNASGEYEEATYHEELESLQENDISPLVERHHICLIRSRIAPKYMIKPFNTEISWNPVDSPTAKEVAEMNKVKADTDKALLETGAIDGFDVRQRVINDPNSGYNGLPDIVPGGPGDREAEQEAKEAEAAADADGAAMDTVIPGTLDPATGKLEGARIITYQKFLNPEIVDMKIAEGDFVVNLTPVFYDDGKAYRMVIDGHHSLAAALKASVHPTFVESVPRDVVFNAVTHEATDAPDYADRLEDLKERRGDKTSDKA